MNHKTSTSDFAGTRPMSLLRRLAPIIMGLSFVLLLGISSAAAFPGPEPEGHAPSADTTVRCEPSSVSALVGETVSIDLYIQDVANLYATDLRVSFDPTIGQVMDQDANTTGTQIQPLYTWFSPGFIIHRETHSPAEIPPNCGASCIWYVANQVRPTPPATGAGSVVRVTFLGLHVGSFPMNWINAQLSAPGGVVITPVNMQACLVTFTSPLAAVLDSFEAIPQPDHVLLTWETVSELDNRGFNLYRGTSPNAPDRQLNSVLIPSSSPGSPNGFSYTWEDRQDLISGTTYYYWVEAVDFGNLATRFGPVSATYAAPTAVKLSRVQAVPERSAQPLGTLLAIGVGGLAIWLTGKRSRTHRG